MTKTISVKELRMNFPKIKKELDSGVKFIVIYRSKPLAELNPLTITKNPFEDDKEDGNEYDLPKDMKDFLKNIDKYAFKADKPFNAAEEIAKDRDDSYETN